MRIRMFLSLIQGREIIMRVRIGFCKCFSSSIIQQVESFSFFGKWTAHTSQRIPPSISPLLIQSEFKPQPLAADAAMGHSGLEFEEKNQFASTFLKFFQM